MFSLANLHSHHFEKDNWNNRFNPITPKAKGMIARVKHTLYLIEELRPTYWFLENPFGLLEHMDFMKKYRMATVTYCQYGQDRMKKLGFGVDFQKLGRQKVAIMVIPVIQQRPEDTLNTGLKE